LYLLPAPITIKAFLLAVAQPMRMPAIPYSLLILWRDKHRFAPAILAVAFSAVLIVVQCGLVLGLLRCTSVPIDHANADIWVLTGDAASLPQAYPIPDTWQLRLDQQPEIERTEPLLLGLGNWHKPGQGSSELCFIIGFSLEDESLGRLDVISPELQSRLSEPGTIVVDEWDLDTLGLSKGADQYGEINNKRVRVVGTVKGVQGQNFVFTFCSQQTARMLLPEFQQQKNLTMCVLARCRHPEQIETVVQRLRDQYPEMGVYPWEELSIHVQLYWLLRSAGGTVMLCTVGLALLVGFVVTSQTLSASVLAALREYAVLDALGIARSKLVGLVLAKSFWIGAGGILLALPITYGLSWAAVLVRVRVLLPWQLLLVTVGLTLPMALASGLLALRTLRQIEPVNLLR
jgi:putative ABC transport system permease protein